MLITNRLLTISLLSVRSSLNISARTISIFKAQQQSPFQLFRSNQTLLLTNDVEMAAIRTLAKGRDRPKPKEHRKVDRPKVMLDDNDIESIFSMSSFREAVAQAIQDLKADFKLNYNLRLNPRVLEDLELSYQGMRVRLADIVTIARKHQDLVINLSATPAAVKPTMTAIVESGLALNPQQDGNVIYVKFPKVTTEHRLTLIKTLQEASRKVKDQLKNRQFQKKFYLKEDKKQSSDLLRNVAENIDYYVKQREREIDEILERKIESLQANS